MPCLNEWNETFPPRIYRGSSCHSNGLSERYPDFVYPVLALSLEATNKLWAWTSAYVCNADVIKITLPERKGVQPRSRCGYIYLDDNSITSSSSSTTNESITQTTPHTHTTQKHTYIHHGIHYPRAVGHGAEEGCRRG